MVGDETMHQSQSDLVDCDGVLRALECETPDKTPQLLLQDKSALQDGSHHGWKLPLGSLVIIDVRVWNVLRLSDGGRSFTSAYSSITGMWKKEVTFCVPEALLASTPYSLLLFASLGCFAKLVPDVSRAHRVLYQVVNARQAMILPDSPTLVETTEFPFLKGYVGMTALHGVEGSIVEDISGLMCQDVWHARAIILKEKLEIKAARQENTKEQNKKKKKKKKKKREKREIGSTIALRVTERRRQINREKQEKKLAARTETTSTLEAANGVVDLDAISAQMQKVGLNPRHREEARLRSRGQQNKRSFMPMETFNFAPPQPFGETRGAASVTEVAQTFNQMTFEDACMDDAEYNSL